MTRRTTTKDYVNRVWDKYEDTMTPLDGYPKNKYGKVRVRFEKCGHVVERAADSILNTIPILQCPKCSGRYRMPKDEFEEYLKKTFKDSTYKVLYYSRKSKEKCLIEHTDEYGNLHIYPKTKDATLNRNEDCTICSRNRMGKNRRSSINKVSKIIHNDTNGEYDYVSGYTNNRTPMTIRHFLGHGNYHDFQATYNDFHGKGSRCSICRESKGEHNIRKYLLKHKIKFEAQKYFKDLKDIQTLSYDFYLPDSKVLVEFQGKQHYEPISFFNKMSKMSTQEKFESQVKHDNMKRQYAKDNSYYFVEIPYTINTQKKINEYLKCVLEYIEKDLKEKS